MLFKLYSKSFWVVFVVIISVINVNGQTYGLQFKGLGNSLDNRTELNLTPGPKDYLSFENEFEISFFCNIKRLYLNSNVGLFGYIVRIVNSEDKNVDLVSTVQSSYSRLKYSVVSGHQDAIVQADFPKKYIGEWIPLKIKVNLEKDKIIFYTPDEFQVIENVGFKKEDRFKIFFGTNDFGKFKTSDVPPMSIKDIRILENGKLKYFWPLNELEGTTALEELEGKVATVKNPNWLRIGHQQWSSNYSNEFDGMVIPAYDDKKERMFFIGNSKVTILSLIDNTTTEVVYEEGLNIPMKEATAVYDSKKNRIFCYLVYSKSYYIYNIKQNKWRRIGKELKSKNGGGRYNHYNSYFHNDSSTIYSFGGYGKHNYYNQVKKLDLNKNTHNILATNDSVYKPRYLAGLGAVNDTVYILGGYGSASGNQLINPQSYYDLIGYSINDQSFFKKAEIPKLIEDMCVGKSFYIDRVSKDYYALVFEKNKFDGELNLIKGNINDSDVSFVANKIPFKFLDIRSSATLMYDQIKSKLYAYSSYTSENEKTKVELHAINYPPIDYVPTSKSKSGLMLKWYYLLSIGIGIGVAVFFFIRKKKKRLAEKAVSQSASEETEVDKPEINKAEKIKISHEIIKPKNDYQLIFFGGFQAKSKDSNKDVTGEFTPLLKELFLLIWLHTFKNDKGISTEKITEILWFDKSEKSARNNRAVNLAKLRGLLTKLGDIKLSKSTGYWKAVFENGTIKSDYTEFLALYDAKEKLTKEEVYHLLSIVDKGLFLRNVQYDWLDQFKASISDKVIDVLLYFTSRKDLKNDTNFIIHLADSIFIFDVTNEDAMKLKCNAQYSMGKHSHAKATYDKFSAEFLEMYGDEYDFSFVEILK